MHKAQLFIARKDGHLSLRIFQEFSGFGIRNIDRKLMPFQSQTSHPFRVERSFFGENFDKI